MIDYRIFLASSILPPVCYDRMAVGNFIRKVNDAFRDLGIQMYLELFLCELSAPDVIPSQLKQEEYDERIVNATDLFLNLYHDEVGAVSKHELELAMASIPAEDILVMFRQTQHSGQSVEELKQMLRSASLPYHSYPDADAVKLAVIRWLKGRQPELPIEIDGGCLRVGGQAVLTCGASE